MKLLLTSILLFSALPTLAFNFNGVWKGKGQWTQKSNMAPINKSEPCTAVEIKLKAIDQTLTIEKYKAKCGQMASDWGPLVFQIKDGKVFHEGDEVGTYDGRLFLTRVPDTSVEYAFNFEIINDTSLRSYYGARNAMGTIVIEGQLAQ